MIATAPTRLSARLTFRRDAGSSPDLGYFRSRYPETVASFGTLPRREEWLRRIWEADARWREEWETSGGARRAEEVVVRGAPPAGGEVEGEFDVVYAGGVTGLLHASVLACRHGRRVLVFDPREVGRTHREWNISEDELRELERAGLFTREEVERAVVNRYRGGVVKFHDAASRIKAGPLWVSGVLDAAIEADWLLQLAAEKLRKLGPPGCALVDGLRFVRAYVEPSRVTVETEDAASGRRRLFAARLFVDASGEDSSVARQLGGGRALTHVCPTVGTTARGYARGEGAGAVDFNAAEILVSTEDASDHRQLVWGGFGGSAARGDYTTSLSFYDAPDSPADKSLLALFERYFESLPAYKRRGAQWRVERPVFGHAPVFGPQGWPRGRRASDDRVMLVGAAAGATSPLYFGGFGAHARGLRRLTHLTHLALEADLLDAASLAEVNAGEPRVAARAASLAEFMRPTPKGAPSAVNETLNAAMAALHHLDERVRRELFQDRLSFGALRSLLGHTARLYPRIFARVRERLGARGTLWWLADVAGAVWRERRVRAGADALESGEDSREEDPAREFARRAAHYKNRDGAEE